MDNCPNKCVDGYYFDPYNHKRVLCQYCAEKRKKDVREEPENIVELLNLPKTYTGYGIFDRDSVIRPSQRKQMSDTSVDRLLNKMQELVEDIAVGVVPDKSILLNAGRNPVYNSFVCAYLVKGYMAGVAVYRYITAYDIYCYRRNNRDTDRDEYEKILNADVLLVYLDAGLTYEELNTVAGVVQLRARFGKPTIMVTAHWSRILDRICSEDGDLELAELYSVEYLKNTDDSVLSVGTNNKGKKEAVFGVTKEEFQAMFSPKSTL